MKLKNTTNHKKHIPFAGAFIEVPVKTEWLGINKAGMVYSFVRAPFVDIYGSLCNSSCEYAELACDAILVACVEYHSGPQVISIEDLMAGIA